MCSFLETKVEMKEYEKKRSAFVNSKNKVAKEKVAKKVNTVKVSEVSTRFSRHKNNSTQRYTLHKLKTHTA